MRNIEFDSIKAIEYAEGFGEGEDINDEERIQAWSYLIRTGIAWKLQGFFGRKATEFIEQGVINEEGDIDWDIFNEIYEK